MNPDPSIFGNQNPDPELDPDPDLGPKLDTDLDPDLDPQLEKCWVQTHIKSMRYKYLLQT